MLRSPLLREWVRRPLRRIGAQHLHGVVSLGGGRDGLGWQRIRVSRLVGHSPRHHPPWVAVVQRCRVLPAFTKRVRKVVDRRSSHLELHVVPRRRAAVPFVEFDRLSVSVVTRVIVSSVTEIDATYEGDILGGRALMANDDDLLVVTPAAAHTFVEDDLAPGCIDHLGESGVALLGEMRLTGVRPPQQSADVDTARRDLGQHATDLRVRPVEQLVAVALPIREVHVDRQTRAVTTRSATGGSIRRRR